MSDTTDPAGGAGSADDVPQHSVMHEGRLMAYIWERSNGGVMRRAGNAPSDAIEVAFADIRVMDVSVEPLLLELLPKCASLDTLKFKLGLEGYDVYPGRAVPTGAMRRF